jgi:carbonic anhydrase
VNFFRSLKVDIPASLVVFLIALPLSLGIALASGAPIKAGLIAAVVGGIVVGVFGGAPLQVSGPAAGLTVMVFGFIQKFGFQATCTITILAGLMQVILGFLGVGQLTLAISPSVIEAMLAGIGVLIVLGQTYVLLGAAPKGSALLNLAGLPHAFMDRNNQALVLGLLTLGILWSWNRFVGKKIKFVPGSLVAVIVGTTVAYVFSMDVPKVNISANLFDSINLPHLSMGELSGIVLSAIALTIVASAESLLCAVATDKLHAGTRANLNRELFGQGVANALSGLLGGLPVTGVIVRSSANINAGAVSKGSAILHGIWLLLFATFMANYLSYIPLAVLAGLLIFTGINLVKLQEIKHLMKFNEALVYFVTLAGVVFINLLWGIGIGFGLTVLMLIIKMSQFDMNVEDHETSIQVTVTGSLTFLGVPSLIRQLDALPKNRILDLVLDIDHLDHASLEALRSWKEGYEKSGGQVKKEQLEKLWKNLDSLKGNLKEHKSGDKLNLRSPLKDGQDLQVSEANK